MSTSHRFIPNGRIGSLAIVFVVHAVVTLVAIFGTLTVLAESVTQSTLLYILAVIIFAVQPTVAVLAYQRFVEE